MDSKNRNLIILIFLCVILFAAPTIYFAVNLFFFTDYELKRNFKSVQVGASREEAIAKLGTPDKQDTIFHLGQFDGFEQEYKRAENSGSKYYLFWYGEIDVVYVMGFNDRDQVILKSCGGT